MPELTKRAEVAFKVLPSRRARAASALSSASADTRRSV